MKRKDEANMTGAAGSSGLTVPPLGDRIDLKIEEAKFFLSELRAREGVNLAEPSAEEKKYRFFTSAFLNAVRSPLQYIFEDVKSDATKKAWYDSMVTARPVLAFIRDERNCNIHVMSTTPIAYHVVKFDIGPAEHEMHQEWPTYSGTNKRVTAIAADSIEKVVEIVTDGRQQGYF